MYVMFLKVGNWFKIHPFADFKMETMVEKQLVLFLWLKVGI